MFIQWDCGSETAGGLCHEETHTLSHTHHSTPNKGTHRWRLWRTESLNKRKVEQCHASLFIHCQNALLSRCKAMNTHTHTLTGRRGAAVSSERDVHHDLVVFYEYWILTLVCWNSDSSCVWEQLLP